MRGTIHGSWMIPLALAILLAPTDPSRADDQTPSRKRDERDWARLNEEFGKAYSRHRFDEALRRAEDSLQLAERAFGPNDPAVAASLNNMAGVLEATGDYTRLEEILQRTLIIRNQALGPGHPDTGKSLTNLGRLKHYQRRYAEAEPLYLRALAIHDAIQGQDRNEFTIIGALHDLASLYRDQEQYAKAVPYVKRELEIWEQQFGPEHPLALPILDMYADLLKRTGDARKADVLESQAARIREKRDAAERP